MVTNKLITDAQWLKILQPEFEKPYFQNIENYIKNELAAGEIIYPDAKNIFNAFNQTPFNNLKIVLLGQDPYHGPNQAHGLSFSVIQQTPKPPSLQNIFKELQTDMGIPIPSHGNLTNWATQGVLLLNASLTVKAAAPMSHSKIGWEVFTNAVIKNISDTKENIVFILWGKFAQQKKALIDAKKHLIIEAAHPSPLSAYNGFWGSKPFSKANAYMQAKNMEAIDWQL